jgi:hypothetical protein
MMGLRNSDAFSLHPVKITKQIANMLLIGHELAKYIGIQQNPHYQ